MVFVAEKNPNKTKEDKYFNNQIEISTTKNHSSTYLGVAKVSKNNIDGAAKGDKMSIGTVLEESIHFLGYDDHYDIVYKDKMGKYTEGRIGYISSEGYENDVLTGIARNNNYKFIDKNYESLLLFLEKSSVLTYNELRKIKTIAINNPIETVQKDRYEEEMPKDVQTKIAKTF